MCDEKNKTKTLMVIEDFDDTRELLEMLFAKEGYKIIACENGVDAIKKYLDNMRCNSHSGILTDLALPDINGLRVLSAIREMEKGSGDCVPIRMGIISASGGMVEGIEMVDDIGVTLNIPKPYDSETLSIAVKAWMNAPGPVGKYAHKNAMTASGTNLGSPMK